MICPVCKNDHVSLLFNLGNQPLANAFSLNQHDAIVALKYDLSLMICNECLYVWLKVKVPKEELFSSNTYLTGVSAETREDMKNFTTSCIYTCRLSSLSKVLDIASNDGTLLEYFKERKINVFGVDPSKSACDLAQSKGIETWNTFFNHETASEIFKKKGKFDIITATNVITHVENPIEFLESCKEILTPDGSIVVEFYNFESIISNTAFDQIYHEHISYFNFTTFSKLLDRINLQAYKVEVPKSQGGSLRVFISCKNTKNIHTSVTETLRKEGGLKKSLKGIWNFHN